MGAAGGADCFHRLQSYVLPAICSRLHGHAAALLRLQPYAGISGAERFIDRRRNCSWRRLLAAHDLFFMVDALWQARFRQSLECGWTRVEDGLSAAYLQLRG